LNCPYLPGNNIAADNNNTVLKIVTSEPNLYINTYRKKHNVISHYRKKHGSVISQ